MNLGASAIVLRPRSLSEILDLACRLCMSLALGLYARLSAILFLPMLAGCLALRHAAGWSWPEVWGVAIALGGVAQGVFTVAVGRLLFSEELGAGQVLRLFRARLSSYLWMLFLSRLLLAAAALPLLLGLPLAWPRLVFVHEASLLEAARAGDAIQRSSRFVTGRVAAVLGALIALLLAQAGVALTVELLGQSLVDAILQLGKPFGALLDDGGSPFALAGFFAGIPYVATARFLHYIDARTRADGWDIQLRFLAIAAREGEKRAAA
ncbi:hypothetical protein ACSRUE_41420 [Sorangium sp. KYC3313]|uniref:hypothetical protein n=1 Tax=Sorangium sp. KYC3313 TaxID=3449740 RepID=UPI003F8AFA73